MILGPIIIWVFCGEKIKKSEQQVLFTAMLTTLIANGIVGLVGTWVARKEKENVLDASIERVRIAFLNEHFVNEELSKSLNRGFEYCDNNVKILRVYAISTAQIVPFVETNKDKIHINKCQLMVRGYGDTKSDDEMKSDEEIKWNIGKWESLKPNCIDTLKYTQYKNSSLNYYCIFDTKFITYGQYIFDEKKLHKTDFLCPFSITDQTIVGRQIIQNSIQQFASYFNFKNKNYINFNEFADRYDNLREADNGLIRFLIKKCNIERNAKILDFGCGTGNYIKGFQNFGFTNIFGLDTSEKMKEIASAKTGTIIYGDTSDINDVFKVIFIIDVIHLIPNISSLAKNLFYKCVDNAVIAIVTQSHDQIRNRRYRDFFPTAIERDLERYHEIDDLIGAFEKVGFSLRKREDYKKNTIRKLDLAFLNSVKNKCFSMFELIDDSEFNKGIKKFEEALTNAKNSVIKERYAGKTFLLFSKS
jgi:SAM-dependent methyltransferase